MLPHRILHPSLESENLRRMRGGRLGALDEQARRRALDAAVRLALAGALAAGGLARPAATVRAEPEATFTVTNLNNTGPGSLRQAIINANSNPDADIITFQSGLSGVINLTTGAEAIYYSVAINGPGAAVLTVHNASANSPAFDIFTAYETSNDVAIRGLTITGGDGGYGGGVSNIGANLVLENVIISGNASDFNGGGVFATTYDFTPQDAGLSILNSTITGNTSAIGGGVYASNLQSVSIQNSVINTNTSGYNGGIGLTGNKNVVLEGSTISGNTSTTRGGALSIWSSDVGVSIEGSTISGNIVSGGYGGGLELRYVQGTVSIENTVITGNSIVGKGGGAALFDVPGSVTIEKSTISGNSASAGGGGLYIFGCASPIKLQEATISGNTAQSGGGVQAFYFSSGLEIINSTISGNIASAGGGGLLFTDFAASGGTVNIRSSTIAANDAASGGGISTGGNISIANSIVGDNTDDAGASDLKSGPGSFVLRYTLVEHPGAASITNSGGNLLNVDAKLGPLANNGGPTRTHLPAQADSPVYNAGDPAFAPPPSTDQRGVARVIGGRIDMGSVEMPARVPPLRKIYLPLLIKSAGAFLAAPAMLLQRLLNPGRG